MHTGIVHSIGIGLGIAGTASGQFTGDPFPDPIPFGIVEATLDPFATIPNSNGQAPRIQLLTPAYDGTGRMFVVDQRGPLHVVSADGTTVTEYLDIRDTDPLITINNEGGFQSVAFHPDFESNGLFYTLHGTVNLTPEPDFGRVVSESVHLVLLEWDASDPGANTYAGATPREVLRIGQPDFNHLGCGMAFDDNAPETHTNHDLLFATFGDGTGSNDSFALAQNTLRPNGKIFRIEPTTPADGKAYTVPADNPFVGVPGTLEEIWAIGFRNPQRIIFDPEREIEQAVVIDIGQGVIEEVNVVASGDNHGWSDREGSFEFINGSTVRINPTPAEFVPPVAEYDHSEGRAITGGPLARGPKAGALEGAFVFGDIPNGRIFYLSDFVNVSGGGPDAIRELRLRDEDGEVTSFIGALGNPFRADIRFGVGEDGRIFATNKRDGIVRELTAIRAVLPCADADFESPFAVLDAFDWFGFQAALDDDEPEADFEPGGGFNMSDVDAYGAAFDGGCTER